MGSMGQLGQCLREQFDKTNYDVIYKSRKELDLCNTNLIRKIILADKIKLIINTAAYTEVDQAEENYDTAMTVNGILVENLAKICKEFNILLVHISTDYVFNGEGNTPFMEHQKTNPICVYGESKLKGERAIKQSDCRYVIIRTSWVFSEFKENFLKTMLRLAQKNDSIKIVSDQIGCPTYAQDIAKAIISVISFFKNNKIKYGIYHYTGDDPCSWYQFAEYIFFEAQKLGFKIPKTIIPIKSNEYKTLAKRPKYSVLNCSKIKKEFKISQPNWKIGVQKALLKISDD
jgi:dTDP-4-dehydrorhamnose reductase